MSELRVLHVIEDLSPGGTERQCVNLVRGLAAVGVRSSVVYFKPGLLLGELERSGIAPRSIAVRSFRSPRFPLQVMELAHRIRDFRPHVVQTYGFPSNLPGMLAGFLAGAPVRIAGRRWSGDHLSGARRWADLAVLRLAQRVVANAEAIRRQLVQHRVPQDKVVVIPNGVDLGEWPAEPPPVDREQPLVGMVAHFRRMKDHATFLRAAREIWKLVPATRFALVGAGPLEPSVREHAERLGIGGRVDFLGYLEGDALHAAVRRFHVSVLTSREHEGLPNALLESMAACRAVVATAVGGTSEIVDDGVNGFLVPPGDAAGVAGRVVTLLADPGLARAMGERGREKVEREFTLERMTARFEGLYRDLLAEARA